MAKYMTELAEKARVAVIRYEAAVEDIARLQYDLRRAEERRDETLCEMIEVLTGD